LYKFFLLYLIIRKKFLKLVKKKDESGTKVLASQLFLDCRARRSG